MEYAEDYHASVLILGPDGKTVLIKDETRPYPLLWKFPGGKMEVDEDPFMTAVREVEEETGLKLDISRLRLVGEQARRGHVKYFFIATIDSFDGLVKKSKEREVTGLFKLSELEKMVDFHQTYRGFYDLAKDAGLVT